MPTTLSPRASSASAVCIPMKPAAPVTNVFGIVCLLRHREAIDGRACSLADDAPLDDALHPTS
jgi:hypothetical protein